MGVHGLSSYLYDKQRTLSSTVQFGLDQASAESDPTPIVVDAWSFIYKLFFEEPHPWVYGGEYELFARDVVSIVQAWKMLHLKPYFVFDGAQPKLKFPEMVRRVQESRILPANLFFHTSSSRRNEPTWLDDHCIIPPLIAGACASALVEAGVPCIWADGEADQKCVELAGRLNAWVFSADSDFAILNVEGYKGYAQMDQMLWEYLPVTGPDATTESDDGWEQAGRTKGRKKKPLATEGLVHRGLLPPTTGSPTGVSFVVYQPSALAAHLKIPITFLPLFASLVGNDFSPSTFKTRFFERRLSYAQRIDRVGGVLRVVLSAGEDRNSRVGKLLIKNMMQKREAVNGPGPIRASVSTLIQTAIQTLLLREPSPGELDEMVESVIDVILQYGAESDPEGPFASRLPSSPHPLQDEVKHRYTEAYSSGNFSPLVLNIVATGTTWPRLFLEDPDVESGARLVTSELVTWTAAILNDAFPVGVPMDESMTESGVRENEDPSSIADDEEDEDELISVIEEQTDSEEEAERERRCPAAQQLADEESEESDDGSFYPSYTNGVPVGLLTNALKRLRRQQKLRGDSSQTHSLTSSTVQSPSGIASPPLNLISQVQLDGRLPLSAALPYPPSKPTSVAFYHRSGLRFVSERLPVPTLPSLLDNNCRGRGWQPHGSSQTPPSSWQGPIQLQPSETRLGLFLRALQCDTSRIKGLVLGTRSSKAPSRGRNLGSVVVNTTPQLPQWTVLVTALRWTVIKMAERAQTLASGHASGTGKNFDAVKWKKREAKAFLLSCIRTQRGVSGGGEASTSQQSGSTPAGSIAPPAEPRAIQLTSQILAAVEGVQQLSQVLLLVDVVKSTGVERLYSGRRFHQLLSGTNPEVSKVHTSAQEAELLDILWKAVEEDGKAEWWGGDADQVKVESAKKAAKGSTTPDGKKTAPKAVGRNGLFKALATLGDDW